MTDVLVLLAFIALMVESHILAHKLRKWSHAKIDSWFERLKG